MAISLLGNFYKELVYLLISKDINTRHVLRSANRYLDLFYLRDILNKLKINVVFDVGANNGQFVKKLRRLGYYKHIISFEPIRDEFISLSDEFKGDLSWKGFNITLGNKNTTEPLNVSESSDFSSFLTPKNTGRFAKYAKIRRQDQVKIKRLDSIFDDLLGHIENPRVFLKTDTQGYDSDVLKGAEGCIENILGLQSEIAVQSVYENMPHYLESLAFYHSLGFDLINLSTVSRGKYNNIIEYDCLMARLNNIE